MHFVNDYPDIATLEFLTPFLAEVLPKSTIKIHRGQFSFLEQSRGMEMGLPSGYFDLLCYWNIFRTLWIYKNSNME